jgi:hypothetical protein
MQTIVFLRSLIHPMDVDVPPLWPHGECDIGTGDNCNTVVFGDLTVFISQSLVLLISHDR